MSQIMTLAQKKKNRFFNVEYKLRYYDFLLLAAVLALSIIGVVAISSADPSLLVKRIGGVLGCAAALVIVSLIDYHFVLKFWWAAYLVNVALLVAVLVAGHTSHGATRWLKIGSSFTFQPSEFTKVILIVFFAQFFLLFREKMKPWMFLPACILLFLPSLLLVYKEPDLSTSIMLCIIFAIILFVGGIDRRIVAAAFIVALPLMVFMIYSANAWETHPILDPFQQQRIRAWLRPEDYATSDAYQTLNSLMAIGSGQLTGKGINTNEITSVLNSGYISESETDLIFTVIGEETGFVGGCAVILLFLFVTVKCLYTAGRAKDLSGRILAASVAGWIGFQSFMNIGVATGVVPNTGIPLPFVSSGLTSLLSTFGAIGIVINIGLQGKRRY